MKTIFEPISKEKFKELFIKKIKSQGCYKNSDGSWSCDEYLYLNDMDLSYFPIKFKEIKGDFNCEKNKLSSFNNFPDIIRGNFFCRQNKFTSFDNFPEVKGVIYWFSNPWKDKETYKEAFVKTIKSFGCYENSDGTWSCDRCLNLYNMDLSYLPVKFKEIKGHFNCNKNKLSSFDNFPDIIHGDFYFFNNNNISLDLEYPGRVNGEIYR